MKKTKVKIFIALLLTALIVSQTACGREETPVSRTSYYLDTVCQIDIYDMDEEEAGKIISGAFSLCGRCEKLLSKTVEGSDVDRLNREGEAEVDDMTAEVIEKGIYYGDLSGGRFDISVGGLTALWDFHDEEGRVPEQRRIDAALPHVDYRNIRMEGNKVTLGDRQSSLDLGGIAKGYICDRVTEYLEDRGVDSAIVNLGGNISVIGAKGKKPFKVGIEKPFSGRSEIIGYVESDDNTFVTSGIYERYFEKDGKLYHHILDVDTGYPVDTDLNSVTVISKNGRSADCDALSTICLMLGSEKGLELIEKTDGAEAVFVDREGNVTATEGSGFVKE